MRAASWSWFWSSSIDDEMLSLMCLEGPHFFGADDKVKLGQQTDEEHTVAFQQAILLPSLTQALKSLLMCSKELRSYENTHHIIV